MKKVFFVKIRFPESAGIAARDALSQIIIRLAAKFSFQGLEDWSVDLKNSKILGAEREFLDLSAFSQRSREMRIFFGKKEDGLLFAKILNDAFSDLKISSPRRLVPQDWMKA